jgi:hypothetical protein
MVVLANLSNYSPYGSPHNELAIFPDHEGAISKIAPVGWQNGQKILIDPFHGFLPPADSLWRDYRYVRYPGISMLNIPEHMFDVNDEKNLHLIIKLQVMPFIC